MRKHIQLIFLGVLGVLVYLGITFISKQFNWGEGYADRPIPTYLVLYGILFSSYALAIRYIAVRDGDKDILKIIIVSGLLFRAAIFPANQIQEDDIYRYIWDGKVFAHGINPYQYAPELVSEFKRMRIQDPDEYHARFNPEDEKELELLHKLKWSSQHSLVFQERINHPNVPTIYPPLTQYVFRLVSHIRPDSIIAMRFAFLMFDMLTLFFVLRILNTLGKNRTWCLVYFWSPLLIKETFNSTHLDIIGISVLCGSLYFLILGKHFWATVFLGFGVMGKFYPAILLPVYIREMVRGHPEETSLMEIWWPAVLNVIVFSIVILIFYIPFLGIGGGTFEGLKVFTTYWENNDSLFALLVYFYKNILEIDTSFTLPQEGQLLSYDWPTFLSKLTVAAILGVSVMVMSIRKPRDPGPLATLKQLFIIMALVFLFSPVQNPWYLNWLVPFLCLFPARSWLLLTGLIGLYYMDFYFDYQEVPHYALYLPWLEYTPFFLLLVWEIFRPLHPVRGGRNVSNQSMPF